MANPAYRQWLQGIVNGTVSPVSGMNAQEASALLQVVGDDFGVNQDFMTDPYAYTNSDRGQVFSTTGGEGENWGYGPQAIIDINKTYQGLYQNEYPDGATLGSNTGYSYGGPTGPSSQDIADEQAYWNDQLANADVQLGRLGGQQQTGERNIRGAYDSAYGRLTQDKSRTERDYQGSRKRTIDDNITAKGEIDTSVRNTANGLQRLLGSRGAGSSSAAQVLAPYAAATQGNEQRGQVQKAYGQNMQGLDTAWGDYEDDWNTSAQDLGTQRDNSLNQLRGGIAQSRAGLLEQKSQAAVAREQAGGAGYSQARSARVPYTQRINELLQQIDSYGGQRTFTPQEAAYQAPDLKQYTFDRAAAPSGGQRSNAQQQAGAYWTLLGDREKQRR